MAATTPAGSGNARIFMSSSAIRSRDSAMRLAAWATQAA